VRCNRLARRSGVQTEYTNGEMDSVNPKFMRLLLIALLTLGLAAFAGACGDDEEEGGGAEPAATEESAEPIKVGMVTDIGGLDDRSFNQSAYEGLKRAESELGAEIRAITSKSNADYVPNLTSLARQQFDLVIAVGFLMGESTEKIANSFPETNFAIIDFPQAAMKSKPKNVTGLLFKEAEAGYLVGYMAGLYVKDQGGDQVISAVGGQQVPAVDAYIAGYQEGAKAANPEIETLFGYSQDFVDQAKCKEMALEHIGQGAQVVFAVAGGCGLGALDAAKERNMQGIGVDADQAYLGDHIMTSALKKVDEAAFTAAQEVQDGSFQPGTDKVFDVKSGGVGYGETNSEGAKYTDKVDEVLAQIESGEIADIPTTPEK
jgi:basic membrane protein A and related proteins